MEKNSHKNLLVSVGIPVYNGSKYILEALKSIEQQDYNFLEIIIIDDGSTDNSSEICEIWKSKSNLPVKFFKNEKNKGLCYTCNKILKHSEGFYLQLFGQDDIMTPTKISDDVAFFLKNDNKPGFIYSQVELINESGESIKEDYNNRINFKDNFSKTIFEKLIEQNFIPAPTVLMRTELIKNLNGFNEDFLYEDWQMWLKIARNYEVLKHSVCNVKYRIHSQSIMGRDFPDKEILRNRAAIKIFSEYKKDPVYAEVIELKLKSLAIYSYFLGDNQAVGFLKETLRNKFSFKIQVYYLFTLLRLPHPGKWFAKQDG